MEKPDLAVYQQLWQLSNEVMLAAEQEDWDKSLLIQQQLHDLYQKLPALDLNLIPEESRDDLLALLGRVNDNLLKLDTLYVERRAFLADFLQGASNLHKVNKAYFSG
ncbi:flagellar protein FliT [Deefgea piscis]|uniref:flagellar protein FliT n=1 Tax=Deefgea piscis TaxID=2739061 RepID=UPI001C7E356C|nr:flagellar protein FliT [Deefgea piscis]QZA80027.1 flagellar protein FliT [Deefgea piscis]